MLHKVRRALRTTAMAKLVTRCSGCGPEKGRGSLHTALHLEQVAYMQVCRARVLLEP